MNRADVPPGCRRFVLSRAGRIEPGDVLAEHGPRIGQRYWVVEYIEQARVYWHAVVRRIELDEVGALAGQGSALYTLTNPRARAEHR